MVMPVTSVHGGNKHIIGCIHNKTEKKKRTKNDHGGKRMNMHKVISHDKTAMQKGSK